LHQVYIRFVAVGDRKAKVVAESLAKNLTAVDDALAALGPPPAPSIRQAVLARRPALRAKHLEGHSYEDIAAALTKQGLPIKPNSLRSYLSGGASASRAGRSAAKQVGPKRGSVPETSMTVTMKDEFDDLLGDLDLTTEASANGKPVVSTRIR
jgi:hypothetical protein